MGIYDWIIMCFVAVSVPLVIHLFKERRIEQHTFCYCPNCRHEMVSDPSSFIEDTDLVRYECSKCGNKSEWNFDIAPVALVVRSDNGYTDLKPSGIIN